MLDKILLILLVYFAYRGYRTGLFRTLNSLVGYIVGLTVAGLNYKQCAGFLDNRVHIIEKISPVVGKKLSLPAALFGMGIEGPLLQKNILLDALDGSIVLKKMVALYLLNMAELSSMGVNNVGEGIIYVVNHFIVDIASFLLLFVLTVILFKFLIPVIFSKASPRSVNFIDRLAGALLGLIKWVFVTGLILLIIVPLSFLGNILGGSGGGLSSLTNQSVIAGYFITYVQKLL